MMRVWLHVLRVLKIAGFLLPWSAACFSAGLLLGVMWGNREMVHQFKERLEEARVRQEVLNGAVQLLAKDKFQARSAAVESMRRLQAADDEAKEQDGAKPVRLVANGKEPVAPDLPGRK